MAGGNAPLASSFQHRVGCDGYAVLQDGDSAGGDLHLHRPPAGAIRHGVEVAADRHHAVSGDTALQGQHAVEGAGRQRLEVGALLGEMLGDDALGSGVPTAVGELIQPLGELDVQVLEIAEAAGQEEVLAHVAEGPFDFALGFGAVRLAGLRQEAVVAGQGEELGIVGDALGRLIGVFDLAQHGGFHAVVEDLFRHAAEAVEGGDVAAEHGLQVLAGDEAGPHHAAVAEHHGEQPDDPLHLGLVGEGRLEEGEIDLGLLAGRRLEATLEGR
jgi:hypothetical protein